MEKMAFHGRVILVTGAGRGIGRAYAEILARRGAKVVVSDVGCALSGRGADPNVAQGVVDAIRNAGGEAVAYTADLTEEDGARGAVRYAVAHYGRIDALIHNAGFPTGPRAFADHRLEPFDRMMAIHARAAYALVCEAWPIMVQQAYGRILLTGSSAMYGYPGQMFYATAKCACIALARSIAPLGEAHNIRINVINPAADSRMADGLPESEFKQWFQTTMKPELAASVAGLLVHEECPVSGETFTAGGGHVARIVFAETPGFVKADLTMEDVREHMDQILSFEGARAVTSTVDANAAQMRTLGFAPPDEIKL